MWVAGPDLTLSAGPLELNLQYLIRRDDDPSFVYQVKETETNGVMGELVFTPDGDRSRWYGAALYNWVEIGPGDYKYHTATGHVSYMLRGTFACLASTRMISNRKRTGSASDSSAPSDLLADVGGTRCPPLYNPAIPRYIGPSCVPRKPAV